MLQVITPDSRKPSFRWIGPCPQVVCANPPVQLGGPDGFLGAPGLSSTKIWEAARKDGRPPPEAATRKEGRSTEVASTRRERRLPPPEAGRKERRLPEPTRNVPEPPSFHHHPLPPPSAGFRDISGFLANNDDISSSQNSGRHTRSSSASSTSSSSSSSRESRGHSSEMDVCLCGSGHGEHDSPSQHPNTPYYHQVSLSFHTVRIALRFFSEVIYTPSSYLPTYIHAQADPSGGGFHYPEGGGGGGGQSWSYSYGGGHPAAASFPQIMPNMSPSTEGWANIGNTPPLPPPYAPSAAAAATTTTATAAAPDQANDGNRRTSRRMAEKAAAGFSSSSSSSLLSDEIVESADV